MAHVKFRKRHAFEIKNSVSWTNVSLQIAPAVYTMGRREVIHWQ